MREYEQSSALADSRQPEAAGKKSRKKKRGKKSKQGGQEEEDLDKLLQSLNIHVASSWRPKALHSACRSWKA